MPSLPISHRIPKVSLPASTRINRDASTKALDKPTVYGLTNGGLNRDKLLGDYATVQVVAGPWEYAHETDTVRLHWGTVGTYDFAMVGLGGQLLSLAGAELAGEPIGAGDNYTGEGLQEVWYEVISKGGEPATSGITPVLVKTSRPGGQDPLPDSPVNDGLAPATAEPAEIGDSADSVTFFVVPWKNISASDQLTLYVAGYAFAFPPIANVGATQQLTLTRDKLQEIDGTGPQTPVTYEVIDAVGNRSHYAPYLLIDIWIDKEDALELIQLVDAKEGYVNGAIDAAMQGLKARVPRYKGWDEPKGQSVTVTLQGTDASGVTHSEQTLDPVTWQNDYYLDIPIPDDTFTPFAGGKVRVHYESSTGQRSLRRLYVVDALPVRLLPPVTLFGENKGELPLDASESPTVAIQIPNSEALVALARITLHMKSDGVDLQKVHNVGQNDAHKPYTFEWDKADFIPLLDREVTFTYTLLIPGPEERTSEASTVVVRATATSLLASPEVLGLQDGSLDPSKPTLELNVPGGKASKPGAMITATVTGLNDSSSEEAMIYEEGEAVKVDFAGWPAKNDGAKATASYTIRHEKNVYLSGTTAFAVGTPRELPAPEVAEATAGQLLASAITEGITVGIPAEAVIEPNDSLTIIMDGNGAAGSYTSSPLSGSVRKHTVPARYLAANFGGNIRVSYLVRHGAKETVSSPLILTVVGFQDGDAHLPKVKVDEAGANGELDFGTFPGDVHVEVPAWPLMAEGQRLWVWIEDKDGRSFALLASAYVVKPEDVGSPSRFAVSRSSFDELANETNITFIATVAFRPEVTSTVTRLQSSGLRYRHEELELPAPTVDEAPTGQLLPLAAVKGVTVRIPADLKPGDSVVVIFGDYTAPAVPWTDSLTVSVPPAEVAKVLGTTIAVKYTVDAARTSSPMTLNVLSFNDQDPALSRPIIVEAKDGDLDLNTFSGDATITIAPWPLIAQGQTLWLEVDGELADSGKDTIVLLTSSPVTAAEVISGLTTTVPRGRLNGWRNASRVTIRSKANFSGSGDAARAQTFPLRDYGLRVGKPLQIDTSPMNIAVYQKALRQATGGQPPYSYASRQASVVRVLDTIGTVVGASEGNSSIQVSDSAGASTSYDVHVVAELRVTPRETGWCNINGTYAVNVAGGFPPYTWEDDVSSVRFSNQTSSSVNVTILRWTSFFGPYGGTHCRVRDSVGNTFPAVFYEKSTTGWP